KTPSYTKSVSWQHHLAAERNELWSLWEGNFMDYLSMGIYRVTVTVESC
ncbi:DUF2787 domain-containing protein, partial [Escherichia coli]